MFSQIRRLPTIISQYKTSPNIGLIKYWGKWDEKEIIPLNTNIGVTLNAADIFSSTKLTLDPSGADSLYINGEAFPISMRIKRIFDIAKHSLPQLKDQLSSKYKESPDQNKTIGQLIPDLDKYGIMIESFNSFPTGSGLASSSSGLSALALCINEIVQCDARYLSRIGSGSACRCLFGNLVEFPGVSLKNLDNKNEQTIKYESKRCLPQELIESQWLANCTSIVILTDEHIGQKEVLSKDGMKRTWETSKLIQGRIREYVQLHIDEMKNSLETQNFEQLMQVIMKDSNQFHATCMDTYPPLLYLNDFSRKIINLIHKFQSNQIGYTFDAGAHAVILMHNSIKEEFKQYLAQNNITNQQWTTIGQGPIQL